jgi:hypothetical protein
MKILKIPITDKHIEYILGMLEAFKIAGFKMVMVHKTIEEELFYATTIKADTQKKIIYIDYD